MGLGGAASLESVLFFSCGLLCLTSHTQSNTSTLGTLGQVPQRHPGPRSPQVLSPHHLPNQAGGESARPLVTYRMRSDRLRARKLISEQDATHPQQALKLPFQGPDLNPRLHPKSNVHVKVEQHVPVAAQSVVANCGEREVSVTVKRNFLGNDQLIRASDLTLGGCAGADGSDHVVEFRADLHTCGSTLTMTEAVLIYSFSLIYSPTPVGGTLIFRTNPAEVGVKCYYPRKQYVSSGAMRPIWTAFASSVLAKERIHFSLRLMTEDWQSQRTSSVYFLSEVIHVEAAVLQAHHGPLRVYVDNCVASAGPDPSSRLSYAFISNHGCLSDSKLTGAKSYFMPRSREDQLHFLLKAFRFHHDTSGLASSQLYITCHLKATMVSVPVDAKHKACSFLPEANRWVASGGDNNVCGCCEGSCGMETRRRRGRGLDSDAAEEQQWAEVAVVGPVQLEEELAAMPLPLLQMSEVSKAAPYYPSIALLCGVGAALVVSLLVFTAAIVGSKRRKLEGHQHTCTLCMRIKPS